MYRPHFPYATPEGCRDEPFEYYFDVTLQPGSTPSVILGPLDKDAPFLLRGVRISHNGTGGQYVAFQLRTADGELLSDDVIDVNLHAKGAGFSGQFQGGMAVSYDEEILLPAGDRKSVV